MKAGPSTARLGWGPGRCARGVGLEAFPSAVSAGMRVLGVTWETKEARGLGRLPWSAKASDARGVSWVPGTQLP